MSERQSPWLHWVAAWRGSLGFRIVAAILAVSLPLSVVASIYDYCVEEESARIELIEHGRSVAKLAAPALPDGVLSPDGKTLERYIRNLVVEDKSVDYAIVRRTRDGGDLLLAAFPDGASEVLADPTTLVVTEPILVDRGGDQIGTFICGLSLRPTQQALRERTVMLLMRSGCGFLLLALFLWLALRRVVVDPLRRLDAAAQRLGRGELTQPLGDFGTTELGRLGRTLDEMRASVHASHESLAQQNRQLLELDQLKSQFLANMSHEIRTPLTSILGGVEILADSTASGSERKQSMSAMQRNGEQLLELVDRLLDLAKLEAGSLLIEPRPIRPDQVVRSVFERFQPLLTGKPVDLHLDINGIEEALVWTDPARLRQILTIIVGNAVKFTPTGRIDVHAALDESGQPSTLRLVVTDTGVGIPAEFLPRLFAAFSQADGSLTRRHGGTGMGLAMAQKIARQLGGKISVQSEVGRGTRVEVLLEVAAPVGASPPPAPVSARAKAVPAQLSGRVLVVDDAMDSQRLLKAMLGKAGLTVELAGNGREAVDAVHKAAQGCQFDLVLMDLQMPELDGVSAIRELRQQGFTLPIVALTAHAMAEDRERCLAAGANGYATKPITRQRLLEVVATHLPVALPQS